MYEVISTGSKGNAVIYHDSILVDCGVSFEKLKKHVKNLQIVLISHAHGDHLNVTTLRKLQSERPTLRIGCGKWLKPLLKGLNNIDIYELGYWNHYGDLKIGAIKLYHDVPNFGFRIIKGNHKTIHCTDTAHLQGIKAKDYDLYAIEHNYDEEKVEIAIRIAKENREYCHANGSINSHLSTRQAWNFIQENRKQTSEVLELHQSGTYY